MTTDQPPPKPRSKRLYIPWATALALLLTTALFCWLVVVPVWQVDRVLTRYAIARGWPLTTISYSTPPPQWVTSFGPEKAVAELGGPADASARLGLYLRMPKWLASRKYDAVDLLEHCGEQAVPVLIPLLRDEDLTIKQVVAGNLAAIGRPADRIVPALIEALNREAENDYMTVTLCESLGKMGRRARAAIPALEKVVRADHDTRDANMAAEDALKKIKGKADAN